MGEKGASQRAIADQVGIDVSVVNGIIKALGNRAPAETQQPTPATPPDLLTLHAQGWTQERIAAAAGLSEEGVRRIINAVPTSRAAAT